VTERTKEICCPKKCPYPKVSLLGHLDSSGVATEK